MGLYEDLEERKNNGEKLVLDNLSREDLITMWWDEDCSDNMLALLFDVKKKEVTTFRNKKNVNFESMSIASANKGLRKFFVAVEHFKTDVRNGVSTDVLEVNLQLLEKSLYAIQLVLEAGAPLIRYLESCSRIIRIIKSEEYTTLFLQNPRAFMLGEEYTRALEDRLQPAMREVATGKENF